MGERTDTSPAFEADLDPETRAPRVRLNFANGWSASIVFRMGAPSGCDFTIASCAACPTGQWGTAATELGESEAGPEEVAEFLAATASREEL